MRLSRLVSLLGAFGLLAIGWWTTEARNPSIADPRQLAIRAVIAEMPPRPEMSTMGEEAKPADESQLARSAIFCNRPLYTFVGETYVDPVTVGLHQFGFHSNGAGDVNADGHADLIVGARYLNFGGVPDTGKAFVYSGFDGSLIYRFVSQFTDDAFGAAVAPLGDVNGDGHDDVAIGIRGGERVQVYSGIDGTPLYQINGFGGLFGRAVSSAGDLNFDGINDLAVGAPYFPEAYAFKGSNGAFFGATTFSSLPGTGWAVTACDIGNDDTTEVITGAIVDNFGTLEGQGVQIWSFRFDPFSGDFATVSLMQTLSPPVESRAFGYALGTADVNADGYDDVIVGAPASHYPLDTGRVYVYSGEDLSLLHVLVGESESDDFGIEVSGLKDIDEDGADEVIVGARYYSSRAGRAYVYSGLTGTLSYILEPPTEDCWFGQAVHDAGDVNGDGVHDIIVSTGCDTDTGRAYVYSLGDQDGDGVVDAADNCLNTFNPGQEDNDGDGIGDACAPACACDCHGDPECDQVINDILDVIGTIAVAFRGAGALTDPSPACPFERTDVNCDGVTTIVDVVMMINVSFRGVSAGMEYCSACP